MWYSTFDSSIGNPECENWRRIWWIARYIWSSFRDQFSSLLHFLSDPAAVRCLGFEFFSFLMIRLFESDHYTSRSLDLTNSCGYSIRLFWSHSFMNSFLSVVCKGSRVWSRSSHNCCLFWSDSSISGRTKRDRREEWIWEDDGRIDCKELCWEWRVGWTWWSIYLSPDLWYACESCCRCGWWDCISSITRSDWKWCDSLLSRTLLESSSSEEGIGASSPVQILPWVEDELEVDM